MKVTWEVVDGYTGGQRLHTTEVDDDDLDACESEREREDYIMESVQDDFERKITWRELSRSG